MKPISIGRQSFAAIREEDCFYIDKTDFIKEWWESQDDVTLITRPRRFGKTLNMNMLECFFSTQFANRGDLFEGLSIWSDEKYRKMQGTYPVITLTFADVKSNTYEAAITRIKQNFTELYNNHEFLLEGNLLNEKEKEQFAAVKPDMRNVDAEVAIRALTGYLSRYYGKRVIILLDEYDTPLQEAYIGGYWEEMAAFIRSLFNVTFKTNPHLSRAILTGITRVSKESIFSDLNNLEVVTTTSDAYAAMFGFTEEEVFAALEEAGMSDQKEEVKAWYDGFTFGKYHGIYNPWSITNFLDKKKYSAYWADSSSNALVNTLIQTGSTDTKKKMEDLLAGGSIWTGLDEQIIYKQLDGNEEAIWSLLLASGYMKVESYCVHPRTKIPRYELKITNFEVLLMFENMIRLWFGGRDTKYQDFVKALLAGDLNAMNHYMNKIALATFSFFDTGNKPSERTEPERFYHGFVLGLMVDRRDDYVVLSNRESGYGRYDVIMEPIDPSDSRLPAIIIEFKVYDPGSEDSLDDTVRVAHAQILKKGYDASLISKGVGQDRIRHYGFAFEGKKVLIG